MGRNWDFRRDHEMRQFPPLRAKPVVQEVDKGAHFRRADSGGADRSRRCRGLSADNPPAVETSVPLSSDFRPGNEIGNAVRYRCRIPPHARLPVGLLTSMGPPTGTLKPRAHLGSMKRQLLYERAVGVEDAGQCLENSDGCVDRPDPSSRKLGRGADLHLEVDRACGQ